MAKGVPTADAAFASGGKRQVRALTEDAPHLSEDYLAVRKRGGAGKWIALVSIVVIIGAAGSVYFFLFRKSGTSTAAAVPAATDAGAETAAPPVANGIQQPPPAEDPAEAARAALRGDSELALEELAGRSATGPEAAPPALRARVESALSQHLLDESLAATDKRESKKLHRESQKRAKAAGKLARAAVDANRKDVDANVAMADATRLEGKKSAEVMRWLRAARRADTSSRDANYVEALVLLRDGKKLKGIRLLEDLSKDAESLGDVRPFYRMALIDFEDEKYDKARERAKQVLAMQAGHAGATALLSRIDAATAVASSDPMPPEDHGSDSSHSSSTSASGGHESYDHLLERGDKKAEDGDCKSASQLYQKALDVNPVGVAALTGLGYCHIDAKQFASAHAKFRAALAISPRYQDALLGVAEAYQQQGLAKQAIDAYEKFLDEYPTSARAAQVKRQIEKLGGGSDKSGGSSDSGGGGDSSSGGAAPAGGGDSAGGTPTPAGGGDSAGGTPTPPGGGDGSDTPAPTPPPAGGGSTDDSTGSAG